jgi:hypothetical protein
MKSLIRKALVLALSICSVSTAFAASGAENDGNGLFLWVFIGFAVMIVALQFIPGALMFLGMAKGLFSSSKSSLEVEKN